MSWTRKHPAALRAYRARWADLWQARLATGAVSLDEEESQRRILLMEIAGVQSSTNLTQAGYTAVMMAMAAELGYEREPHMREPQRAAKVAKIEHLARRLAASPDRADAYIDTVLQRTGIDQARDREQWRTRLDAQQLHRLMLTLETQRRRQDRAA